MVLYTQMFEPINIYKVEYLLILNKEELIQIILETQNKKQKYDTTN